MFSLFNVISSMFRSVFSIVCVRKLNIFGCQPNRIRLFELNSIEFNLIYWINVMEVDCFSFDRAWNFGNLFAFSLLLIKLNKNENQQIKK